MTDHSIIDLFAGAGGWDEGLRELGHDALGIETDALACATAEAAGHPRLMADIAELSPDQFDPVWGLIGSPPCQAYSTAGRKLGRQDKQHVIACARELAAGVDRRTAHRAQCQDDRSLLTVEPLRWALALRPRWVAMEQVPPVLELWELFGELLTGHGYRAAVGILSAEQYGVPQSRRRCFLIASLDGPVTLPAPTHRSYNPRRPDQVQPGEENLLPWMSMAGALGWRTPRMTHTNCQTDSGRRPRGLSRPTNRPARTVDTTAGVWTVDQLDPQSPSAFDDRRPTRRPRSTGCPSQTLTSSMLSGAAWTHRRPATTVLGDPRIHTPGAKRSSRCPHGHDRAGRHAVRVSPQQAGVLQGFRRDYPWQGARTRQFRQIGNAVCPPVARAVLGAAMAPSLNLEQSRSTR